MFSNSSVILCQEEERKRLEEVERQRRERRYILPDEPTIIVHPNWAAKNGKFDCSVMSLSVLLDYRLEDNKEHSFEVSLTVYLMCVRPTASVLTHKPAFLPMQI